MLSHGLRGLHGFFESGTHMFCRGMSKTKALDFRQRHFPAHNRKMSAMDNNSGGLVRYLGTARQMLIFTGAGISTASGIPDFRGPQGIWTRRKPVYYQDFMASEAARIEHWDYKLEGWDTFRGAQPNTVHRALVRFEEAGKLLLVV